MAGGLRARLAVMMAGQYFVLGAWVVPLGAFLKEPPPRGLGWTGEQTAGMYTTLAVGGLVAPLFVGVLADRLFAAERVMGVLHLAGAALLALAGWVCAAGPGEGVYPKLFALLTGYALSYSTTLTLSNSLALRHLPDPARQFGGVRVFGTAGWIASGFAVGLALDALSPQPFYLAAAVSLALGLFCFGLPHTPPTGHARPLADVLGLSALRLLADRSFAVFAGCALAITMVQAFYTAFANDYLKELGVPRPAAVQTLGQWAELGCMLLLTPGLRRLGLKGMMLVGLLGWVVRYALLGLGSVPLIVAVALPLHGVSYTLFNVVAALYMDRVAPGQLRASAQGVVTFLTLGAGALLGNAWAGWLVDRSTHDGRTDWATVWLVPAAVAAGVTVAFAALFRAPGERELTSPKHQGGKQ
jgi:nucleoside transporter